MESETLETLARTIQFCRELAIAPGTATDERIARALTDLRVAIVADADNLHTPAAQSAVVGLSRLVLGYGASLRLVFPETLIAGFQAPLRGDELRAGLVDLAGDVVPGSGALVSTATAAEDLVFVVGSTPWDGAGAAAWRLRSTGSTGRVDPVSAPGRRIEASLPLGALASAAIAAGEPFKHAMRSLGVELLTPEAFAPLVSARVGLGPLEVDGDGIDLGALDLISGGAITNAALFCLLRVPGVRASARIFEPQDGELSNVNRYELMRRSTSEGPKIAMLGEWALPMFTISGDRRRIDEQTIAAIRPLAPRVLVGTDSVPPRWTVQREWPQLLVVGSTADWSAIISEHRPGGRCIGCLNPEDEPAHGTIATVSFVSFWAGLVAAARLLRDAAGAPYPSTAQVTEVGGPLRLDGRWGFREHALRRHLGCPVGC